MRETAAWLAAAVLTGGTVWYCRLLYNQKIKSSPAGWAIAALAMAIGYFAYWDTSNPTLAGNVTQLIGAIEVWFVLIFLMWSLHKRGELILEFDYFQKCCLFAAGLMFMVWRVVGQASLVFWLVQILMVIAYSATAGKLIAWKKNHDSAVVWATICITSVIGFIPAYIDGDNYGMINSARVFVSSGITTVICLRLNYLNKLQIAD